MIRRIAFGGVLSWIAAAVVGRKPAPRTLDLDDLAGIDVAESIVLQRVIELERKVDKLERRRDRTE